MRGVRTTGIGIALGLWGSPAFAQNIYPATGVTPATARVAAPAPAAKLGRIRLLAEPTSPVVARGQAADPARPAAPTAPAPQPMPGNGTLGVPRPLPGPSVTEIPGAPATAVPGLPPGATIGAPIPVGQPIVVGQPIAVGQPYPVAGPGVPIPVPSVLPGGGCATGNCPTPSLDSPLVGGVGGGGLWGG
ncbi:MAG: hypothetical protein LC104_11285, partial [Bacteroidales bacterium]|nr:hypothetical protein [Bacteroidales bacterium]